MTARTSVAEMAEAMAGAALAPPDRQSANAIHRLMSSDDSVEPSTVAGAIGIPVGCVNANLDSGPGVYSDREGQVVAAWGHAIAALDPEYRLRINDTTTYVTGARASLDVDAGGVHDHTPAGAVGSIVVPNGPFGYDAIESEAFELGRAWIGRVAQEV